MKAFVEHLCKHCGIVRAGESAEKIYDDYSYSVTFVKRKYENIVWAEFVGFDQKEIPPSAFEAIIRCINHDVGLLVTYERAKLPGIRTRVYQLDPDKLKGRILMKKTKIPHVSEAKTHDDHKRAVGLVVSQVESGKYTLENWQQSDITDAKGRKGVRISVDRFETDPNEPAVDWTPPK